MSRRLIQAFCISLDDLLSESAMLVEAKERIKELEKELLSVKSGSNKTKAANPMIQEALNMGKDTTGLCTIREAAQYMFDSKANKCEMYYVHEGKEWNIELRILRAEGT